MSRILLSAYACEPGKGSEPEVGWMWATELTAAGHEVWVITREANRRTIETRQGRESKGNLHFVYCDLPRWLRKWKRGGTGVHWYYALWQWCAYQVARRLTRSVQFDCVQHVTFVGLRAPSFMGWLGLPFVLGPVSGGESVPHQLRKGMSTQAKLREWLRNVANRAVPLDPMMRASFRRAQRILVTTEASRRLIPGAFQAKCEVQLGVGLNREYLGWTGPGSRSPAAALRVLYVGRLLEWKGVDFALRAVQALRHRGVAVRFTIVGSGPAEERLRRLARELELGNELRWLKWVSRPELDEYYYQSDLLLFPSLRDSGGMVVLEALAHGLPVVCTDCGGPGLIVNERCGRVVQTKDRCREEVVAGFTDEMDQLGRNRALLARLSRGARARAWEFDFQKVVTRVHPRERETSDVSGLQGKLA